MHFIALRFLQKTALKVSGATILALASLFVVFALPQSVSAQSAFQLTPTTITNNNTSSVTFSIDTTGLTGVPWAHVRRVISNDDFLYSASSCSLGASVGTNWTGTISYNINNAGHTSGPCTATGYYYSVFYKWTSATGVEDTSVTPYYVRYYWNSSAGTITVLTAAQTTIDQYSLNQNTRFLNVDITGTSTIQIEADYFLDLAEIDTNVSEYNPTLVNFQYSLRPTTTFNGVGESINNTVAGTSSVSTQLSGLADGVYDVALGFSNAGCATGFSACPFPDTYIYSDFTISGGVLTATGTPEVYNSTTFDETQKQPCSITEIGGCLINAGTFLFVPSSESISSVTSVFTELKTKLPFVYVFQASSLMTGLYSGTASTIPSIAVTTGIGTITFISEAQVAAIPYVGTLRSLIAAGLWLMLFTLLYRKTLTIHDKVTV